LFDARVCGEFEAPQYREIGKMMKFTKALFGAALIGASSLALAGAAQAECGNCNRPISSTKVNTVYKYKTVQQVRNVTQYKDVDRTKYMKHVNRIVTVTRVQPVTRVNLITRVHNRTVILRQTQHVAQTAMLPPRTVTVGKTIHVSHKPTYATCNCN
jgi:hypothetical protein